MTSNARVGETFPAPGGDQFAASESKYQRTQKVRVLATVFYVAAWNASMTSAGMRPRVDTLCPLRRAHSRIAALCSRSIAALPRPDPAERPRLRPPTRRPASTHCFKSFQSFAAFLEERSIS